VAYGHTRGKLSLVAKCEANRGEAEAVGMPRVSLAETLKPRDSLSCGRDHSPIVGQAQADWNEMRHESLDKLGEIALRTGDTDPPAPG